jgi:hypothetical protein
MSSVKNAWDKKRLSILKYKTGKNEKSSLNNKLKKFKFKIDRLPFQGNLFFQLNN